ncbi:iron-sulfur cluster assembly scaffold protein [Sphingopyxis yananensis]|jgi:NifU-like protein involved in Fe-S cluster formation|uniref:iron-sulfur cluster assembly scaffold protein n=1 Tax=Sphingopyxis yananensis TaxID=2886687 RepID=UPI001D122CB7|nr:iron-sulfur cluster assembly scaffold protein [Sphingopyxis yananensis]MCC2602578.1 iron-sulfur cluster assembly scaffold protein [Sphingopyxis yananensis]
MSAPLYNRQILMLAVENAQYPPLTGAHLHGVLRSSICGSQISMDVDLDAEGQICDLGMAVQACALGQASASLFARHAKGRGHDDISAARDQLLAWLRGEHAAPLWPDFAQLAAVKDYPARHSAVMLPFDVAVMVLDGAAV